MGLDYALVHLYYTIPPAIALTLVYYKLCTSLDVYKIAFLIAIAVTATIPWDSYLIRNKIWSYPPHAVLGLTVWSIPIEELFFFVIQTYNTSLLYLIVSKPTFHPAYLRGGEDGSSAFRQSLIGTGIIGAIVWGGAQLVYLHGTGLYMGLILIWAGPFLLLLWCLAHQFILGLPRSNVIIPVFLPTFFLWVVDTLALRRGTWVIENGTKLGWQIWRGLEIEEAVFFLATNLLIVFGLVAFDNALAIVQTFPSLFPDIPELPSPALLVRALLVPTSHYDENRLEGLRIALGQLRLKSRSFYLASGVFQGRLKIDLVILYAFCRISDDLVDNSITAEEARHWVRALKSYLDIIYGIDKSTNLDQFLNSTFSERRRRAIRSLPISYLSPRPLYELVNGFEMDIAFSATRSPISDWPSLKLYALRVAGTVAESCIELGFYHSPDFVQESSRQTVLQAGRDMGIALQLVNIARDIQVDAEMGRVYIPTTWLKMYDLTAEDILANPQRHGVEQLRTKLLATADEYYKLARPQMELLPKQVRGPMKVAVESYMEIGRTLRRPRYEVKAGRATVPKLRRLMVAWRALE